MAISKRFLKNIIRRSTNEKIYVICRKIYLIISKYLLIFQYKINRFSYLRLKKNQKTNSDCGFIYIAFGELYFREAVKSAEILKRYTNYPIHIFTDQKVLIKEFKEAFFSFEIIQISHKRSKVDYISLSPFDKTIYLDSDIVVDNEIDELFKVLEK